MQRRTQLEEQKADLTSSNNSFEREIKEAEKQLDPIQKTLNDLKEEKAAIEANKEKHAEEVRSVLESIKQNGNKVRELHSEIERYCSFKILSPPLIIQLYSRIIAVCSDYRRYKN